MPHPNTLLSVEDRCMRYVEKTDTCWKWTGAINQWGYGRFRMGKTHWISSRVSYTLFKGDIPEELIILHSCDNPICVNPEHLSTGTHQDNMDEMKTRGRKVVCKGERNGTSKLKDCDVREILVLKGFGYTDAELATQFNISSSVVNEIVNRKAWKHVLL